MDRIAAAIAIALCALVLSGGWVRDVMAAESAAKVASPVAQSQPPMAVGTRGARVLSLVQALEALRTVPGLVDRSKV